MANISTYLENKVVDHTLGTTAYTKPTAVYVALATTTATAGASGTEVTGGSYARQSVTWNASSSGSATSSATVTFSSMPACTVTTVEIYDASTGGNMLYFSNLGTSQVVNAGGTFTISSGNLTTTLS